jgi:hypothetical protein
MRLERKNTNNVSGILLHAIPHTWTWVKSDAERIICDEIKCLNKHVKIDPRKKTELNIHGDITNVKGKK